MQRMRIIVPTAIAILALAGCSSTTGTTPTGSSGTGGSGELVSITVGSAPSVTALPLYAAIGHEFDDQNLQVTLETVQSGAEAVPRLLNGELAFSVGDIGGSITASANSVPLTIATELSLLGTSDKDDYSSIVTDDPSITSAADLSGHTLAVNQLNGTAEIVAKAAIDAEGGDSSKVSFIELPFPQMIDSVKAGRVDAAMLVEPFGTQAAGAGLTTVLHPGSAGLPGGPSTVVVTAFSYQQANPDVVKRFVTAVNAAAARLNADPDAAREVLAANTQLGDLARKVIIPPFAENADTGGVNDVLDLMTKYSALQGSPNQDQLLAKP